MALVRAATEHGRQLRRPLDRRSDAVPAGSGVAAATVAGGDAADAGRCAVKRPDEETVADAVDRLHDDSWRTVNKPALSTEQVEHLLLLWAPVFAPKVRLPSVPKEYRKSKPKSVSESKPLGVTSQARARRLVRERSGGICEVCGVNRATNYQHRKGKAHCSPEEMWAVSNGLDVCGHGNVSGCHGLIHQNPTGAVKNGWTVNSWADPKSTPVFRMSKLVFLDDEGGFDPVEERVA